MDDLTVAELLGREAGYELAIALAELSRRSSEHVEPHVEASRLLEEIIERRKRRYADQLSTQELRVCFSDAAADTYTNVYPRISALVRSRPLQPA